MLLGQRHTEQVLDHRGEAHPLEAGQPAAELGVEQPPRHHPEVGQAGQVLGRRVDHPLRPVQRGAQRGEVGQRLRVDQRGPGAAPAQLDQECPLAVAVAGGALGVDGDRAGARGHRLHGRRQAGAVRDHHRDAVARHGQGHGRRQVGGGRWFVGVDSLRLPRGKGIVVDRHGLTVGQDRTRRTRAGPVRR
jgi:hypothetical protein